MTEGGRPYGGANERNEEGLPGEHEEPGQATADPVSSPRAAQGGMSGDVTRVAANDDDPDGRAPGMPDATGPQG